MSTAKPTDSLSARIDDAVARAQFTDVFQNRLDASTVRQLYETNRRCLLSSTEGIALRRQELDVLVHELDASPGIYKSLVSGFVGNDSRRGSMECRRQRTCAWSRHPVCDGRDRVTGRPPSC